MKTGYLIQLTPAGGQFAGGTYGKGQPFKFTTIKNTFEPQNKWRWAVIIADAWGNQIGDTVHYAKREEAVRYGLAVLQGEQDVYDSE